MFHLSLSSTISAFLCSDLSKDKVMSFQQSCMQELIEMSDASMAHQYQLTADVHITNCCSWIGITCEEGIVREIMWRFGFRHEKGPKTFVLQWLPSSLRIFDMSHIPISSTLKTRKLPRELVSLMLEGCKLKGPIDCRTFPPNLRYAHLKQNHFTGTVHLYRLPRTLEKLDLCESPFDKVLVANRQLPESLEFARFASCMMKIPLLAIDAKKVDKRVQYVQSDFSLML